MSKMKFLCHKLSNKLYIYENTFPLQLLHDSNQIYVMCILLMTVCYGYNIIFPISLMYTKGVCNMNLLKIMYG